MKIYSSDFETPYMYSHTRAICKPIIVVRNNQSPSPNDEVFEINKRMFVDTNYYWLITLRRSYINRIYNI